MNGNETPPTGNQESGNLQVQILPCAPHRLNISIHRRRPAGLNFFLVIDRRQA